MIISWVVIIVFGLWLAILTVFVIQIKTFFKQLSQDVKVENITTLLKQVFENDEKHRLMIEGFSKEIARFEKKEQTHMQKYGFVRFNPFGDMGGDHSFCLTLLDGRHTGFVLTGLHTRDRTRMYVKYLKRGKSEYDLSKEEKKSLEIALKN